MDVVKDMVGGSCSVETSNQHQSSNFPIKRPSLLQMLKSKKFNLRAQPGNINVRLESFKVVLQPLIFPRRKARKHKSDKSLDRASSSSLKRVRIKRRRFNAIESSDDLDDDSETLQDSIYEDDNPFNQSDDSDYLPSGTMGTDCWSKRRAKSKQSSGNSRKRRTKSLKPNKSASKKRRAEHDTSSESEDELVFDSSSDSLVDEIARNPSLMISIIDKRETRNSESHSLKTETPKNMTPPRKTRLRKKNYGKITYADDDGSVDNEKDLDFKLTDSSPEKHTPTDDSEGSSIVYVPVKNRKNEKKSISNSETQSSELELSPVVTLAGIKVPCTKCNKFFKSAQGLKLHTARLHNKNEIVETPVLSKRTDFTNNEEVHEKSKHTEKEPRQPSKSTVSDSATQAKQSIDILPLSKSFPCKKCLTSFCSMESLALHMEYHKKSLSAYFQCKKCKQGFFEHNLFQLHGRESHDFPCVICNLTFVNSISLEGHKCSDNLESSTTGGATGIRITAESYECDICKKKIIHKEVFITHMKKHGFGQAFKCKYCLKRYVQEGHCKIHEKNHEDMRTNFGQLTGVTEPVPQFESSLTSRIITENASEPINVQMNQELDKTENRGIEKTTVLPADDLHRDQANVILQPMEISNIQSVGEIQPSLLQLNLSTQTQSEPELICETSPVLVSEPNPSPVSDVVSPWPEIRPNIYLIPQQLTETHNSTSLPTNQSQILSFSISKRKDITDLRCVYCYNIFKNWDEMEAHAKRKHRNSSSNGINIFNCPHLNCPKQANNLCEVEIHQIRQHNLRSLNILIEPVDNNHDTRTTEPAEQQEPEEVLEPSILPIPDSPVLTSTISEMLFSGGGTVLEPNQGDLSTQTQLIDSGGKLCPVCDFWVPSFKLENHGSLFHANNHQIPFPYTCRLCSPEAVFQTFLTLIDHMEVSHQKNLSTPPATNERDKFLNNINITTAHLRDHLLGIITKNSESGDSLSGNTGDQVLTSGGSTLCPIGSSSSSTDNVLPATKRYMLLISLIIRKQMIRSYKLLNLDPKKFSPELRAAMKQKITEAWQGLFTVDGTVDGITYDSAIHLLKTRIHSNIKTLVETERSKSINSTAAEISMTSITMRRHSSSSNQNAHDLNTRAPVSTSTPEPITNDTTLVGQFPTLRSMLSNSESSAAAPLSLVQYQGSVSELTTTRANNEVPHLPCQNPESFIRNSPLAPLPQLSAATTMVPEPIPSETQHRNIISNISTSVNQLPLSSVLPNITSTVVENTQDVIIIEADEVGDIEAEMVDSDDETTFTCLNCNLDFGTVEEAEYHLRVVHEVIRQLVEL